MPIHFSIGFVAENTPKRPYVAQCVTYLDRADVSALYVTERDVNARYNDNARVSAHWPREDGMNCNCDDVCVSSGYICAPRGDYTRIIFSVYDTDGDEFPVTGAQEIVFIVADSFGGTVRITKRLTTGGITISTNGYQFVVTVLAAEAATLVRNDNYYEAQVTNSAGLKKTVSAGKFKSQDTMIKDL